MIPKRTKYNNKKVMVDGVIFHSKKEAARYGMLKMRMDKREITQLQLQPRFTILGKQIYRGEKIRKMEYVADFMYFDNDVSQWIVEDVKGWKTDVYKIKRKMFIAHLLKEHPDYIFLES